eukprot:CAMPEP_0172646674 /NCGR_PEP_ID=MMETSP1068-20121228/240363_1 /TAXON_ID=35684 /ORGANISM="Pseudopedinella elastica, Strain CCMP716" /LENGTH=141 /DNA_ID=CAMNT_0013460939 /DNA_START=647 /DNA_END=1072 /DNA_ORIENTATION=-
MIGSVAGLQAQDFPTHAYDASKAALHALTRKLAHDLAKPQPAHEASCDQSEAADQGAGVCVRITVNALAPGYVPSQMTQGLASWGVECDERTARSIPLGRMGQASDLAGAALFLASPAGSWITGAVLPVDGGVLTTPISLE